MVICSLVHGLADGGIGGVDQRRRTFDADGGRRIAHLQPHVDARELAHLERDAGLLESPEAGPRDFDFVIARRNKIDAVFAALIGLDGTRESRFHIADLYLGVGHSRVLLVQDIAQNAAGNLLAVERSEGRDAAQNESLQDVFHGRSPPRNSNANVSENITGLNDCQPYLCGA